jgi:serine/threonine protein kinase
MTDAQIAETTSLAEQALPIGTKLSGDQFTIVGHLGAGGFGITYHAQDNTLGRTIVIKECFPEDFCVRHGLDVVPRSQNYAKPMRSIVNMFMREARSLAKLRHPNIVGVHRAFEENETAYMALDWIDGRDLFDILEAGSPALSPARVSDILLQLLDAIEKVHEMGLLHRDISPDNILLEKNGTPVLIDFGAARADSNRHTRAVSSLLVVKDGYSPQEFYVAGSEQAPCSDLYALAATFYHVLSGQAPTNSQTRMMEIASNRPDPCVSLVGRIKGYSEEFLQAIDQAMRIHPADRIQSAAKWRALISSSVAMQDAPEKSKPILTKGDISLELEMSLNKLVEETNNEVRKSIGMPVEQPPADLPKPEVPTKPDWIDEFNQESVIPPRARTRTQRNAFDDWDQHLDGDDEPKRNSLRSETNWIDRAREKQERMRSDQMAAWSAFEAGDTRAIRSVASQSQSQSYQEPEPVEPAPAKDPSRKYRPIVIMLSLLAGFVFVLLLQSA